MSIPEDVEGGRRRHRHARLPAHYRKGGTQVEIAQRAGPHPQASHPHLGEARATGLVQIIIDIRCAACPDLERAGKRLRAARREVVPAPAPDGDVRTGWSAPLPASSVGDARPDGTLGITWGWHDLRPAQNLRRRAGGNTVVLLCRGLPPAAHQSLRRGGLFAPRRTPTAAM